MQNIYKYFNSSSSIHEELNKAELLIRSILEIITDGPDQSDISDALERLRFINKNLSELYDNWDNLAG